MKRIHLFARPFNYSLAQTSSWMRPMPQEYLVMIRLSCNYNLKSKCEWDCTDWTSQWNLAKFQNFEKYRPALILNSKLLQSMSTVSGRLA